MTTLVENLDSIIEADFTPLAKSHDNDDIRYIKAPTKRKRSSPSTSFQLAQPPPKSLHSQLNIRPTLLLQLQQISGSSRPTPIFDVLQISALTSKLTRFIPGFYRKYGRASGELFVLNSDSYSQIGETDNKEETFIENNATNGIQDAAAILNVDITSTDPPAIRMCRGSSWRPNALANGGYDFTGTDSSGLGTKVRWFRRGKLSGASKEPTAKKDKGFSFTIINPNERRHPVIASMTSKVITISNYYFQRKEVSDSESVVLLDIASTSDYTSDTESVNEPESSLITVSDDLRTLILMTGTWIAFQEGWWKK